MGWSTQIPPRTGWYWVRGVRPLERRVVYLDYGTSRVYDGLLPAAEPASATSIVEYCLGDRRLEWYLPELPPPA